MMRIGRIDVINEGMKEHTFLGFRRKASPDRLYISNGRGPNCGFFTLLFWPEYDQLGTFKVQRPHSFKEKDYVRVEIEKGKITRVDKISKNDALNQLGSTPDPFLRFRHCFKPYIRFLDWIINKLKIRVDYSQTNHEGTFKPVISAYIGSIIMAAFILGSVPMLRFNFSGGSLIYFIDPPLILSLILASLGFVGCTFCLRVLYLVQESNYFGNASDEPQSGT